MKVTVSTDQGTWDRVDGEWVAGPRDLRFLQAIESEALPEGVPAHVPNPDWFIARAVAKYLKGSIYPVEAEVIYQEGRVY